MKRPRVHHQVRREQKPMMECPDCHTRGAELDLVKHAMFCPAKTCSECGTTFTFKVPMHDHTMNERLCDECLQEREENTV